MRSDQEQTVVVETIETPFSIKAKEDAERFSKQSPAKAEEPKESVPEDKPAETAPQAAKPAKVDAKEVVTRATALPGVAGCAVARVTPLLHQPWPALPLEERSPLVCLQAARSSALR